MNKFEFNSLYDNNYNQYVLPRTKIGFPQLIPQVSGVSGVGEWVNRTRLLLFNISFGLIKSFILGGNTTNDKEIGLVSRRNILTIINIVLDEQFPVDLEVGSKEHFGDKAPGTSLLRK